MIKKSNIKYETYATSKFYMNLFVYSNIFQYEYPFVSYSYHFFYTNIFGYSPVKNYTHLSPSVHQVKRRIQERRQQHWMPCLTPLPSPILFSENIFPRAGEYNINVWNEKHYDITLPSPILDSRSHWKIVNWPLVWHCMESAEVFVGNIPRHNMSSMSARFFFHSIIIETQANRMLCSY